MNRRYTNDFKLGAVCLAKSGREAHSVGSESLGSSRCMLYKRMKTYGTGSSEEAYINRARATSSFAQRTDEHH